VGDHSLMIVCWRGTTRHRREDRSIGLVNRKQGQGNKTAEKLTDIVREPNMGVADHIVSDQKLGIELTQAFFNGVINSLHTQARSNREITRQLSNQQQRAQEAMRTLAVDAVGAYMDFANSTFFFYQGGLERAGRSASPSSNGHRTVSQARNGKLPVENYDYYDSLNAKEAIAKMEGLSVEEVEHLRDHEVSNKDRSTVTDRFNARIEAIEANLPVENYDSLGVVEILDKMEELGVEELKQLQSYEARTKKRPTLIDHFNARVEEVAS
jgi:hypothetical protein